MGNRGVSKLVVNDMNWIVGIISSKGEQFEIRCSWIQIQDPTASTHSVRTLRSVWTDDEDRFSLVETHLIPEDYHQIGSLISSCADRESVLHSGVPIFLRL